ncbi:MAG: N-acetyltransferase [Bacteriovoracaceae bacterium]|nr:N-acetyltransferase [Bacteriovoracaceae bacterium]
MKIYSFHRDNFSLISRSQIHQISALDEELLKAENWGFEYWSQIVQVDKLQKWCLYWAQRDGDILGFALYQVVGQLVDKNAQWHLCKIVVSESEQNQSIATKLWEAQRRDAPASEIFLEVRASNLKAISFYLKKMMTVVGWAKAQYSDGEAALRMLGPRKKISD